MNPTIDPKTISNFKAANPGLNFTAEDHMHATDPVSLANFQKANPGLAFTNEDLAHYNAVGNTPPTPKANLNTTFGGQSYDLSTPAGQASYKTAINTPNGNDVKYNGASYDTSTDEGKSAYQNAVGANPSENSVNNMSLFGRPYDPTIPPNQLPTNTGDQNTNTLNDAQNQKALQQRQNDDAFYTFKKTADAYANGAIPLTGSQQAQIQGLTQQYQQWIQQQQLQNTNSTGVANIRGYQTGAAEYDPTFQANTIGSIFSAGQAKVADLSTKMASAIGAMTSAFETDNYNAVKDAYDQYQKYSDDHNAELDKTIANTQAAIKASQDAQQKIQDNIDAIALEAVKNGATPDVIKNIRASTSVGGAISAAGDYMQTGTGLVGDYLMYKRQTMANGGVPVDYQTYKEYDQQQKDAHDLAMERAKAAINASGNGISSGDVGNLFETLNDYEGKKYLTSTDLEGYDTKQKSAIITALKSQGIKTLSPKESEALTSVEAAQDQMSKFQDYFTSNNIMPTNWMGQPLNDVNVTMQKYLQTNDKLAAFDTWKLTTLTVMSGLRGAGGSGAGGGAARLFTTVSDLMPQSTDTVKVAKDKIDTINSLLESTGTSIVGKTPQQKLTDQTRSNEAKITGALNQIKTTNPKLYSTASSMYTSVNPDTGQPYTADDILQAFPELNTQ